MLPRFKARGNTVENINEKPTSTSLHSYGLDTSVTIDSQLDEVAAALQEDVSSRPRSRCRSASSRKQTEDIDLYATLTNLGYDVETPRSAQITSHLEVEEEEEQIPRKYLDIKEAFVTSDVSYIPNSTSNNKKIQNSHNSNTSHTSNMSSIASHNNDEFDKFFDDQDDNDNNNNNNILEDNEDFSMEHTFIVDEEQNDGGDQFTKLEDTLVMNEDMKKKKKSVHFPSTLNNSSAETSGMSENMLSDVNNTSLVSSFTISGNSQTGQNALPASMMAQNNSNSINYEHTVDLSDDKDGVLVNENTAFVKLSRQMPLQSSFSMVQNPAFQQSYRLVRRLGQGSFGSVFLIASPLQLEDDNILELEHIEDQPLWLREEVQKKYILMSKSGVLWRSSYVMKRIQVQEDDQHDVQRALAEVEQMKNQKHPFIVGVEEFYRHTGYVDIILEWAKCGDLDQVIKRAVDKEEQYVEYKKNQKKKKEINEEEEDKLTLVDEVVPVSGKLSEDQVCTWMSQICLATYYLHSRKILHRDIKTANIFQSQETVAKLGDFGAARILQNTQEQAKTQIGTPYYLSPEICNGQSYGPSSDIWSLGVVFYELLALKRPFVGGNIAMLVLNIIGKDPDALPKRYSKHVRDLILLMLEKDVSKRISMSDILMHPALRKHVAKILALDDVGNAKTAHNAEEKKDNETEQVMKKKKRKSINSKKTDSSAITPEDETMKRRKQKKKKKTLSTNTSSGVITTTAVPSTPSSNHTKSATSRHLPVASTPKPKKAYTSSIPSHIVPTKPSAPKATTARKPITAVVPSTPSLRSNRAVLRPTSSNVYKTPQPPSVAAPPVTPLRKGRGQGGGVVGTSRVIQTQSQSPERKVKKPGVPSHIVRNNNSTSNNTGEKKLKKKKKKVPEDIGQDYSHLDLLKESGKLVDKELHKSLKVVTENNSNKPTTSPNKVVAIVRTPTSTKNTVVDVTVDEQHHIDNMKDENNSTNDTSDTNSKDKTWIDTRIGVDQASLAYIHAIAREIRTAGVGIMQKQKGGRIARDAKVKNYLLGDITSSAQDEILEVVQEEPEEVIDLEYHADIAKLSGHAVTDEEVTEDLQTTVNGNSLKYSSITALKESIVQGTQNYINQAKVAVAAVLQSIKEHAHPEPKDSSSKRLDSTQEEEEYSEDYDDDEEESSMYEYSYEVDDSEEEDDNDDEDLEDEDEEYEYEEEYSEGEEEDEDEEEEDEEEQQQQNK